MRFTTVLALCAAPLAMAGTPQDGLFVRTEMAMKESKPEEGKMGEAAMPAEGSKSMKEGEAGSNVHVAVEGGSSKTEIIIIWVNNGGGEATKTMNTPAGTGAAAAATHSVIVGGTAGLVYTPNEIQAAVGDMVIFTFMNANHTVTQSAFDQPCKKITPGMDSGFMPNPNNTMVPAPQMAMQVTVATPIWFYCRQKSHCGKGMTFSINPTAGKTQAMFQQLAIAQNGTGALAPIQGGQASATAAPPAASAAPAAEAPKAGETPAASPSAEAPKAEAPSMSNGSGQQSGDSCSCSCLCGVASFPNAQVQGLGSYGGMSGAMPMAMLEK
ncbi:hypothetical protein BJ875DRAFT_440943 [Amylocarpus encephaloides]|uniref:Phytocyanin domain-containing protein n=1 Tax=Amylocarpus encephaloides TaxID=45428 RepID=A0A9P7YJT9_9HELO|nr:hypothetical protein BJ875DRAFT_440943 [Amylocarpus encephaloides]